MAGLRHRLPRSAFRRARESCRQGARHGSAQWSPDSEQRGDLRADVSRSAGALHRALAAGIVEATGSRESGSLSEYLDQAAVGAASCAAAATTVSRVKIRKITRQPAASAAAAMNAAPGT